MLLEMWLFVLCKIRFFLYDIISEMHITFSTWIHTSILYHSSQKNNGILGKKNIGRKKLLQNDVTLQYCVYRHIHIAHLHCRYYSITWMSKATTPSNEKPK